ncbi:MAG: hypothetical protein V1810_01100 [Candidatus Beckwithbacteria bacterium]
MWKKYEGLILLLLLVAVLRIPSLFEPYWYGDEGIYLVLGQGLRKGLIFYRDIHDNKPPLLYMLAAAAGNVFYFRLILMVWFGASVAVFLKLTKIIWPKNKFLSYCLTLTMIGLTTIFEGNVANAEIFIVLPVTLAMLLAASGKGWFKAGLLFSVGFLLKVPAAFDLAALILWLAGQGIFDKRIWKLILGFSLPIAITIGYFGIVGGLERYVRSALLQNIGYLSSWGVSNNGLMVRLGITILALGLVFWAGRKYKFSRWANLILIWFLMALFGALLSGRPYLHYLIQPAIPAVLLLGLLIKSRKWSLRLAIAGVLFLSGYWWWQIKFWSYPVFSYYENFIKYIARQKDVVEYRNYFDKRVNQSYKLGEYLLKSTNKDDRVFIWGDEPGVYALADRLPVGRYTVAYHIVDFNGYEEVMIAWDKQPPRVVIVMDYEQRPFKQLDLKLATDYVFAGKIERADVYRKLESI